MDAHPDHKGKARLVTLRPPDCNCPSTTVCEHLLVALQINNLRDDFQLDKNDIEKIQRAAGKVTKKKMAKGTKTPHKADMVQQGAANQRDKRVNLEPRYENKVPSRSWRTPIEDVSKPTPVTEQARVRGLQDEDEVMDTSTAKPPTDKDIFKTPAAPKGRTGKRLSFPSTGKRSKKDGKNFNFHYMLRKAQ